ncbi:hypothetical protein LTR56_001338 [Elasticomyces elasticus]|nr:hypothetical protein LTR56_001338 [Elasticomyces elasticus]KAK3667519.1 hypothetical protein LTR22_001697 [Elasticomyces elasticus]KAK4928002.1 hypothetical protein LTR49_005201 [Elasticomyces elasticus]KAK5762440.1 hypothetical protein LTS12_007417 [Elasticomyces elasticus]
MPQFIWLVTGCSTGFGNEFVREILKRGDKVIATARKAESLKELKDLGAATLQLDVTASLSELEDKMKEAVGVYGRIDILLLNAGYVQLGTVEEIGDDLLKQFHTNTFGAINCLTALMPHWRERQSGFLVVNSSYQSQWSSLPMSGAYSASKAALDRLVTTFAAEVGFVKTLTIHPGHFRTEVAAPEKIDSFLSVPSKNYQPMKDFMTDFAKTIHGNQPGDTKKAVELTVDMVRGEGKAEGKQIPARIWLGSDAYKEVKAKCEEDLRVLEEWKSEIEGTDVSVNGTH